MARAPRRRITYRANQPSKHTRAGMQRRSGGVYLYSRTPTRPYRARRERSERADLMALARKVLASAKTPAAIA